jgi:hypothetical protein
MSEFIRIWPRLKNVESLVLQRPPFSFEHRAHESILQQHVLKEFDEMIDKLPEQPFPRLSHLETPPERTDLNDTGMWTRFIAKLASPSLVSLKCAVLSDEWCVSSLRYLYLYGTDAPHRLRFDPRDFDWSKFSSLEALCTDPVTAFCKPVTFLSSHHFQFLPKLKRLSMDCVASVRHAEGNNAAFNAAVTTINAIPTLEAIDLGTCVAVDSLRARLYACRSERVRRLFMQSSESSGSSTISTAISCVSFGPGCDIMALPTFDPEFLIIAPSCNPRRILYDALYLNHIDTSKFFNLVDHGVCVPMIMSLVNKYGVTLPKVLPGFAVPLIVHRILVDDHDENQTDDNNSESAFEGLFKSLQAVVQCGVSIDSTDERANFETAALKLPCTLTGRRIDTLFGVYFCPLSCLVFRLWMVTHHGVFVWD